MDLTIERVYEIEHELIVEISAWEHEEPEGITRLAFYNEGIHDMTTRIVNEILRLLQEN